MAVKEETLPPPETTPASETTNDACPQGLALLDVLPVIGPLRQHGKAYACGHRIRIKGWTALAVTALVCAIPFLQHGVNPGSAVLALYLAVLAHITFVDLEHFLIPNVVVLPAVVIGLLLFPVTPLAQGWGATEAWVRSLAGAGLGFGALALIFVLARGGMGAGDMKLAAFLGAILGFPYIITGLLAGFILGGIVGLALLLLGRRSHKQVIPYGPALAGGAAIHLLAGPGLYHWYLSLMR